MRDAERELLEILLQLHDFDARAPEEARKCADTRTQVLLSLPMERGDHNLSLDMVTQKPVTCEDLATMASNKPTQNLGVSVAQPQDAEKEVTDKPQEQGLNILATARYGYPGLKYPKMPTGDKSSGAAYDQAPNIHRKAPTARQPSRGSNNHEQPVASDINGVESQGDVDYSEEQRQQAMINIEDAEEHLEQTKKSFQEHFDTYEEQFESFKEVNSDTGTEILEDDYGPLYL
jgi:hypothetical protein